MAAKIVVVWKNLNRIFEENESLTKSWKSLKELQTLVTGAQYVMQALEEQKTRVDEDDDTIRNLRVMLYEVDDLLDEILTFVNRSSSPKNQRATQQGEANTSSSIVRMVCPIFSSHSSLVFTFKWERKIRIIKKQLKWFVEQLTTEFGYNYNTRIEFEPTGDFTLAKNEVIGRESDIYAIIKMLLKPKANNPNNLSVIPIVGPSGIGKSVLAKTIYDDQRVNYHFDIKIWITVSHITDEAEIIQAIAEAFVNRKSNDYRVSSQAKISHSNRSLALRRGTTIPTEIKISESRLRKEIKGKLFLLVLDNALLTTWQDLKKILGGGARGSHILVTTRSPDVAELSHINSSNDSYILRELGVKDSSYLFRKFAFEYGHPNDPDLKQIGDYIANKCESVPLTIKVAASLLYKKAKDDWLSFYRSMNDANNIMEHVLDWSYNVLPTRLKACFLYCSLFPETHIFNKRDLIRLWIAQGYIDLQNGQNLEERAEKYFLELSRRCFFEDMSTDDLGNIITCKIHPIMRRMAGHYATGAMNLNVLRVNQVFYPDRKHISFTSVAESSVKLAPSLVYAESLRTLLSVKEPDCDTRMHITLCGTLMSSLTSLRVLDLHDLGIMELPNSISKLVHLRYLDLSKNDLVIFPKSGSQLLNLQTLKLNSCARLNRLLGNFAQLVNLKHLEIDDCDSLTCMPFGIERITQIETLSRFIMKDCSAELGALGDLTSLRGRLAIELSGNWATTIPKKSEAELQTKIHLEELKISWAKTVPDNSSYQNLLEQLQPNNNLKILCIEGYKGEHFPSWIQRDMLTCLRNLVVASIEGCSKCEYLPPFSELPLLKRLTLRHMTNVKYMESETSQESSARTSQESRSASPIFFRSLEELNLQNFYKLEGWRKEMIVISEKQEAIRSFPCLKILKIWNCQNLKYLPQIMEVSDLDLRNVNQILLVDFAKKLSKHHFISKIKHLQIQGCNNLKSFEAVRKGLGGLPRLKVLVVERCNELQSMASEFKHLTSLESLEISGCNELDLSDNGISPAANSSTSSWIPSRIFSRNSEIQQTPWASLKSLLHLTLREIPKMETLPEGLQHVQSLKKLLISACPALKELPEWINCLTALQVLRIESCRRLTRLPDGIKEIRSLIRIEIIDSEKLKECYRLQTA